MNTTPRIIINTATIIKAQNTVLDIDFDIFSIGGDISLILFSIDPNVQLNLFPLIYE